jgi:hypothetical protein
MSTPKSFSKRLRDSAFKGFHIVRAPGQGLGTASLIECRQSPCQRKHKARCETLAEAKAWAVEHTDRYHVPS